MSTYSNYLSGLLHVVCVAGLLFLAVGYTSTAKAAQGCGFGYHLNVYGGCVQNHPGPFARPAPLHPGCWRTWNGALRCYR